MTSYPDAFVATPAGRLHTWFTADGSLHAATLSPVSPKRRDRRDAQDAAATITINGIAYTLHVHLRSPDQPHRLGRTTQLPGGWWLEHGAIRLRRADDDRLPGTRAAVAHVTEALIPTLLAWADSRHGRALRVAARRIGLAEQLRQVTADIDRLRAEQARLRAELAALGDQAR